ncbi:MAG: murein biosynthesis integral membrane protein MurJ [Anaerolineales bacterium]|nr:murein biosynthesis integral membrane protein MurJ [Anaerolineales bacterium]
MRSIFRASLLVSALFAIDKVVSLGVQFLVARAYGVGHALDAYNAANNLPDTLFLLISGGALNLAMIPLLRQAFEREGRPGIWRLFSQIANLAFLVTAALAVLVFLFAPWLVSNVVAPDFDSAQKSLTVDLMRLNLAALLIFSISGLISGSLQAHQHFILPGLAPMMYSLGQLAGLVILGPTGTLADSLGRVGVVGPLVEPPLRALAAATPDLGVFGLAWGVVLGAALHLLIQVPGLIRFGFRWTRGLGLERADMREMLTLMGPRVLTMACISAIFIVNDNIASGLEVGAISALSFGWRIQQIPETLFGTALGVAILPALSELVAQGKHAELTRLLRRALWILLALTVPIAVVGSLLMPWVAGVIFEERAGLVAIATQSYLLGLVGHSLKEATTRTFYAYKDARTPLVTAAVNLVIFAGLGWALTPIFGLAALALANSLSFTIEAALQAILLSRRRVL